MKIAFLKTNDVPRYAVNYEWIIKDDKDFLVIEIPFMMNNNKKDKKYTEERLFEK